jgi:hypothetical protein
MADAGIKNVVVSKKSLPAVNNINQYIVRYRIVTDDRNRYSQWSPMYLIDGSDIIEIDADVAISGRSISIVWQDPEDRSGYDIFVRFDGGPYSYHGTASTTNYSLLSQGTSSFQFSVQAEGMVKEINQFLEVYESEIISLV